MFSWSSPYENLMARSSVISRIFDLTMAKHNTYMWTGYLKNWLQPVFCSPVSSCHLSFLFRSGFGLVALFENQTKPDFKTLAFGHK